MTVHRQHADFGETGESAVRVKRKQRRSLSHRRAERNQQLRVYEIIYWTSRHVRGEKVDARKVRNAQSDLTLQLRCLNTSSVKSSRLTDA